jgi:hypothetical protein
MKRVTCFAPNFTVLTNYLVRNTIVKMAGSKTTTHAHHRTNVPYFASGVKGWDLKFGGWRAGDLAMFRKRIGR